jgi:hypothetical protein
MYETSIRVRPDTSDYAALVVSFFGGPKPQHDVIVFNPILGSVISASPGDYRIAREANGWTKITLVSSAAPGSNAIRATLYPRHGSPEERGAIRFGGGELNRIDR